MMTSELDPLSLAGNLMSPIVLTSDWEYAGESEGHSPEEGGWKARFRRLWFVPGSGRYEEADWNREQFEVFAPLAADEKPVPKNGERVFAVFRGRWELIGSSGTQKSLYGVVMEAVAKPSNAVLRPPNGEFMESMGKTALFSKDYPEEDENGNPIEPEYDDFKNSSIKLFLNSFPRNCSENRNDLPSTSS